MGTPGVAGGGKGMDKLVTGFISSFERRYQRLEKVIKQSLKPMLPAGVKKRRGAANVTDKGGRRVKKAAVAAAADLSKKKQLPLENVGPPTEDVYGSKRQRRR
jgi:hypothetical protein